MPEPLQCRLDADGMRRQREYCPFFEIGLDARTLVFSVAEPAHDPALDAIAEALRGLTAQRSS